MIIALGILFAIGAFILSAQNKVEGATGSKGLGCLAAVILAIIIAVTAEIAEN